MLVACGVAERDGKVLICKRPWGVPYAGSWEFPSEELVEGETLESSLEMAFFDRFSAVPCAHKVFFAFDSSHVPDCRIFTFKVNFPETKLALNVVKSSRWVRIDKLKRFRFFPDYVTIVNEIEKKW